MTQLVNKSSCGELKILWNCHLKGLQSRHNSPHGTIKLLYAVITIIEALSSADKQMIPKEKGQIPMGRNRAVLSITSLLLITTAVYLGLQIYFEKTAGRPDQVDRAKAHTPKISTLANETQSSISNYQIAKEGNPLDTAAGVEITPEKINIAALKNTRLKLKLWGTITGNGLSAYAIIEEVAKREQKIYQAGETVQNATIRMILREKVVLDVEGKYEILEIETKRVDVDAKNKYGVTALIDASHRGQKEQVEWLIIEGANLNARDNQGDTALMNAAIKGHSGIVELLIANGADVHAKDNAGNTALIDASKYARESTSEVLSLLIDHGAEVNEKNKYGETALMNAARWGHKENVAFLIDEGADINAKTMSGETALEFAASSPHSDVVELLKFHGAKE